MSFNAIIPLLVPLITGIVAALSLTFKESRMDRDRRNVRQQALAEASAEVAFASEWFKAHQLLGNDAVAEATQRARELLADAEAKVVDTQNVSVAAKHPVTLQRLFLVYPLRRRSAKFLRVLFWISILGLVIDSISTATDASTHNTELSTDIVMLVVFAVVVLVLHVAVVVTDQQESTPASARHPSPEAQARQDSTAAPAMIPGSAD